jgi:hypothetical protein
VIWKMKEMVALGDPRKSIVGPLNRID